MESGSFLVYKVSTQFEHICMRVGRTRASQRTLTASISCMAAVPSEKAIGIVFLESVERSPPDSCHQQLVSMPTHGGVRTGSISLDSRMLNLQGEVSRSKK